MATFSLGKLVGLFFVWTTFMAPVNMDDVAQTMKDWGKVCVVEYGGIPAYEITPLKRIDKKEENVKMGVVYCRKGT